MKFPTLDEVTRAAQTANVIPIGKTVLADTETPVSVWMKLYRKEKYSFLLESVTGGDIVARYSFIGGNPFMTFIAKGGAWEVKGMRHQRGSSNPIEALREIFSRYTVASIEGVPRFTGGAVGYFAYDSIRLSEVIPDKNPKEDPLDDLFFAFYRDVIAFDNKEHRLILISNIFVDPAAEVEPAYRDACKRIESMQEQLSQPLPVRSIDIRPQGNPASNVKKDDFERAVRRCKDYIFAGDIFQGVLSQRFTVAVEADPFDLYRILRVVNPSPYMYFLMQDDAAIIGASPEMLVRVEDGTVEVRPIAGTCRRGRNDAEDQELIDKLLADPKERAEHIMLVDLGRNDVGRVSESGTVRVTDMMHIEKYSHVIHIVSNVEGKLKKGCDIFDALFSCFPAGTLSGAPKIRAMEIIDELECVKRGLYGGALGYIDFSGRMDTCIVIRTIFYHNGKALIQVGAGIVADSDPSREYQETVQKATALFTAIAQSEKITG
ncbi:MAG: anthranilate synthase component I [Chitinispirillaceae bacterium]|nr:anthranilate synthase component I [Chitinispirillaceae bacterium]